MDKYQLECGDLTQWENQLYELEGELATLSDPDENPDQESLIQDKANCIQAIAKTKRNIAILEARMNEYTGRQIHISHWGNYRVRRDRDGEILEIVRPDQTKITAESNKGKNQRIESQKPRQTNFLDANNHNYSAQYADPDLFVPSGERKRE